jgi:hypothetical protein
MYKEIHMLYFYCLKHGIKAELVEFIDGYAIRFPNGGDVVQHRFSYGSCDGCVEPAIGSRLDYCAVPLEKAKRLIKRNKERLNKEKEDG